MRCWSAPGKLVIAGEYAVLEGHPALVTAVDRRVWCASEPAAELSLEGLRQGPFRVTRDTARLRLPDDASGTFDLALAVLQTAFDQGVPLPSAHIRIDSDALSVPVTTSSGGKLGLGSSAAVAAALTAVVCDGVHPSSPASRFDLALRAHLRFSLGKGSGIDVAAATYGGTFTFKRGAEAPPRVAPLEQLCPSGLIPVVVYAGHSVSTRVFLDGYQEFKRSKPTTCNAHIERIQAATEHVRGHCTASSSPVGFIEAIDACRIAMQGLGEAAGLHIVSEPHRAIASVARRFGGAAKPSGAGGGDIAICFVPVGEAPRLRNTLFDAGFAPLDVGLGAEGVRDDSGSPRGGDTPAPETPR